MGDGNAKKAPAKKNGKTQASKKAPAKQAAGKAAGKAAGEAPAGPKGSKRKATKKQASKKQASKKRPAEKQAAAPRAPVETREPVAPGVTAGIPKDEGRMQPTAGTPRAPEVVPEPEPGAEGHPQRPLPDPITIEIDRQMERLEDALEKVREEVGYWARKGIYTRVRFRFRGRQVLPDIPVAAFLAAEAATFWWSGLLRALAVNVGGGALFDVELISDAEPHLARAQEHLLAGDTEDALAEFRRALDIDRDLPAGHHGVGTCLKLQGDRAGALAAFRRARRLDPHGETGRQAQVQIDKLQGR